jgi:Tol biopolymer transport system component
MAYVAESGSTWDVVEIYVMNADGSGQTNLTQSSASDFAPSWSPDRQRIAFDRNLGTYNAPDWEIFVMNADGGGQSRLTFSDGQCFMADWSPAGDQLAFHAYFDDYTEIFLMNADGSGVTNITHSGNAYASIMPDWR